MFFYIVFASVFLLTAAIIGPVVVGIILTGNSAVVVGLWPAHFPWTYFCVARFASIACTVKLAIIVPFTFQEVENVVFCPYFCFFGLIILEQRGWDWF